MGSGGDIMGLGGHYGVGRGIMGALWGGGTIRGHYGVGGILWGGGHYGAIMGMEIGEMGMEI